jgi:hypothetical protein
MRTSIRKEEEYGRSSMKILSPSVPLSLTERGMWRARFPFSLKEKGPGDEDLP